MTDILGPSSNGSFVVTSRPTDSRINTASDTWFADCTSPSAQDGTEISAGWLNKITAVLRVLTRGNGALAAGPPVITEDDADAEVLNAVLALIQRGKMHMATDVGGLNELVANISPAPPELVDGMLVVMRPVIANTGAATLKVGAIAEPIISAGGGALTGGELQPTLLTAFRWNATLASWQIHSPIAGGLKVNLVKITASGTYNPSSWAKFALAAVTGGGGGGSSEPTGSVGHISCGYGGGAGATAIAVIPLAGVASLAAVVGAGGTGSPTGSLGPAGSGSASSLGSFAIAGGGAGAQTPNDTVSFTPCAGGVATVGDILLKGNQGGCGFLNAAYLGGTGYQGGSSFWTGVGDQTYVTNSGPNANGADGVGWGCGGGGGVGGLSGSNAGGDGAPGVIFILEIG